MPERPTKRLRGSYAKHICLRCRERRIKCQIPDGVEVDPSGNPQPPDQACERCRQRGLDCIVRKTTLGRPAHKTKTARAESAEDSSPRSPRPSELVLLDFEHNERPATKPPPPTSTLSANNSRLTRMLSTYFDLTCGLLARDPRFGSAIVQCNTTPRPLESIIDTSLAGLLDRHLVWLRVYMPWLPRLGTLMNDFVQSKATAPTRLLIALLALTALDSPSTEITDEQRLIRGDLQSTVKRAGQEVLFSLPRHRHTVHCLQLLHQYRPLSLVESHQAAVLTLNGVLYPTLICGLQQQLGMHLAAGRLKEYMDGNEPASDVHQLVFDAIQWCICQSLEFHEDLSQGNVDHLQHERSERELAQSFAIVDAAIERGLGSTTHVLTYYFARCQADDRMTLHRITKGWCDLSFLASVIHDHEELCARRKIALDRCIDKLFRTHGKSEETYAILQILNMEMNHIRTNVFGLAMFFAIMSSRQVDIHTKGEENELAKHYSSAVHEIQRLTPEKSDVWMFLERYGDTHMDGLERELSDFISLATEVQLSGVAFAGPPRHTTFHVLLVCKDIVENNAVRIRLDGEIHPRVDMQLILFQEAARRLEGMEFVGGSAEAIARGSMFTAAAKLIRSLHRILSQWKRAQMAKQPPKITSTASSSTTQTLTPGKSDVSQAPMRSDFMEPSGLFPDDFFADWDNWPQLNAAEFAYSFPFDYGANE